MEAQEPLNEDGIQELVARLAVAVMAADGRIADAEVIAAARFDGLQLPSLSTWLRAEVERARRAPIDVARTASELAFVMPGAGPMIISALAQIAVSDHDLSQRELEVLGAVAREMRVNDEEVTHALHVAATRTGIMPSHTASGPTPEPAPLTPVAREDIRRADPSPTDRPGAVPRPSQGNATPNLTWALPILGLSAGASIDEVDAAYAALIRRYNPVAVMELGPEFTVLAVQRLNTITTAYLVLRQAMGGRPISPAADHRPSA